MNDDVLRETARRDALRVIRSREVARLARLRAALGELMASRQGIQEQMTALDQSQADRLSELRRKDNQLRVVEKRLVPAIAELSAKLESSALQTRDSTPARGALGERNSRVIPQDVKITVAIRDQGKCVQCGSAEDLHYDHKIPWSRGGANTAGNIQLLCGTCNRRKGADDISV